MFQCIIQQRNGWIHAPSPEMRDVFPDIRLQLNEQLRCLDVRMESQVSLIQELQDFFRRRAELEIDYSKSLEKLAKSLQLRHKEQKQKREQWPLFSSYACWQQLVNQTKSLSKDHAVLSEIYAVHLVARLQTVIEDVQRIYKRCREIGYETHEEILRVLQELHTTTKTYHSYQTECKAAEGKLRTAESQRLKLQQTTPKDKLERSKKYRLIEKEVLKRKNKYTDARLKALKAKNEYQLCLEASNTTIHKYFVEDLSDLIDCMDLGFCSMVSRAILMHVTADQGRCRAVQQNADNLSHTIQSMDGRADKQKFLEQHSAAFMIPKRIEFQGQQNDEPIEPELQKALHQEMEQRLHLLGQRLNNLRAESDEIWKTLETAEKNLLEHLNTKDYDTSGKFGDPSYHTENKEQGVTKSKAEKQEIEEFYLSKIREYILGTSRIARLDAKAELIRNALEKDSALPGGPIVKSNVPKRKRIGRMNMSGQPKLFGGSLEEYLEATNEEIPLIMRSCIRIINLYGLHHQGIFRVSGSQVEISNFREGFERGEDPLADTTDASDINSVAGVLKLFLRELREPLFPIIYFEHFVSLAKLDSKHEVVMGIKKFLLNLPRSVVIVIRYLFAFLNHLSEYADENMMDAYNLAICFGPTLMPAPEDKDQVQYQNQVNELIKNMIQYHEELFPKDLGGMQYEKYISEEPFLDIDVGDSPTEQNTEDPDSEVYPSEDESDTLEATAQFDFNARSDRELSLRKGETVVLRKQVSNDWWQGTVNGKDGLVPDKYISLKIKDEDRDKTSEHMKSSSSEESVRKRRPSANMSINSQLSIFGQQQQNIGALTQALDNDATTKYQLQHQAQQLHAQIPSQQPPTTQIHQQSVHQLLNEKIETIASNKIHTGSVGGVSSGGGLVTDDCDYHYDTVDNVKAKYSYHDQPHSFENSMDFLEDINHFQYEQKKPSEPIYAEPSKVTHSVPASSTAGTSKSAAMHFEEYDGVVMRGGSGGGGSIDIGSGSKLGAINNRRSETIKTTTSQDICEDQISDNNRHSDGDLFKECSASEEDDGNGIISPTRKFHSKSFSLSENRIGVNLNVFQQNKELWEKRAELNSQQTLNQSRILERKRVAPDLVMDLPLSANKDAALRSSRDSLDTEVICSEELTSAERFASQNQCTLKKNERFSTSTETMLDKKEVKLEPKMIEKPKAEVKPQEIPGISLTKDSSDTDTKSINDKRNLMEEVLHIDEDLGKDIHKSPIPARNTQKYVSQFADLKLTGGCLSQPDSTFATNTQTTSTSSASSSNTIKILDQTPQLTSFKPQVRVKPNILKKPFVRPPTTPEMTRRGGSGSSSGQD